MAATFTEEDLRLLEKTISIREKLIDNIVTKELPTKDKDLVAFTNLLESVDRSIFNKAKIKIEDSNSKTNEETKEILRDLLLNLHKSNTTETPIDRDLPEFVSTSMDINEGELITKNDTIDIKQFIS